MTVSKVVWDAKMAEPSVMQLYNFADLRFAAPFFSTITCFLNGEKAVYAAAK
jgi:hypothetical protein